MSSQNPIDSALPTQASSNGSSANDNTVAASFSNGSSSNESSQGSKSYRFQNAESERANFFFPDNSNSYLQPWSEEEPGSYVPQWVSRYRLARRLYPNDLDTYSVEKYKKIEEVLNDFPGDHHKDYKIKEKWLEAARVYCPQEPDEVALIKFAEITEARSRYPEEKDDAAALAQFDLYRRACDAFPEKYWETAVEEYRVLLRARDTYPSLDEKAAYKKLSLLNSAVEHYPDVHIDEVSNIYVKKDRIQGHFFMDDDGDRCIWGEGNT